MTKATVWGNEQFTDPVHDVLLDEPIVLCWFYGINICFYLSGSLKQQLPSTFSDPNVFQIMMWENIDPIELQYFSATLVHYPSVCYWCGNIEEMVAHNEKVHELFQRVHSICLFCKTDVKSSFTRHPCNSVYYKLRNATKYRSRVRCSLPVGGQARGLCLESFEHKTCNALREYSRTHKLPTSAKKIT